MQINWTGFVLVALGALPLFGGLFDWDWYMNLRRARRMTRLIGRTGARILYMGIGAVLIGMGFLIVFNLWVPS